MPCSYKGGHGGMKRNKHGATEAEGKPARMRNRGKAKVKGEKQMKMKATPLYRKKKS